MMKFCVGVLGALVLLATAGCASGVYYPFGTGTDCKGNPKAPPALSQDYYNKRPSLITPS